MGRPHAQRVHQVVRQRPGLEGSDAVLALARLQARGLQGVVGDGEEPLGGGDGGARVLLVGLADVGVAENLAGGDDLGRGG